jgi:hypothetical protein
MAPIINQIWKEEKNMADLFDRMAEKWPSAGFVRPEAKKVTGGFMSPKTLANLHSLGEGPTCHMLRGRAYYELETFIPWLREWCAGKRGGQR